MPTKKKTQIIGILLAAGKGARFDASGVHSKLLQKLPNGDGVAAAAAKNLLMVLPAVQAVVRPGAELLATQLRALGCEVSECERAALGMGASLAFALERVPNAPGWIIALADMPQVQSDTIAALADALDGGADIAVPTYRGQRGNPVAFSRKHLAQLLALAGDQGARSLLQTCPVVEVAVDDAGIRLDIDTPADLARLIRLRSDCAGF